MTHRITNITTSRADAAQTRRHARFLGQFARRCTRIVGLTCYRHRRQFIEFLPVRLARPARLMSGRGWGAGIIAGRRAGGCITVSPSYTRRPGSSIDKYSQGQEQG